MKIELRRTRALDIANAALAFYRSNRAVCQRQAKHSTARKMRASAIRAARSMISQAVKMEV